MNDDPSNSDLQAMLEIMRSPHATVHDLRSAMLRCAQGNGGAKTVYALLESAALKLESDLYASDDPRNLYMSMGDLICAVSEPGQVSPTAAAVLIVILLSYCTVRIQGGADTPYLTLRKRLVDHVRSSIEQAIDAAEAKTATTP